MRSSGVLLLHYQTLGACSEVGVMNQVIATYFVERYRCLQCKHRLEQPILMPAGCGDEGCMAINPAFLFHMHDTHGIPEEMYREWLLEAFSQ